MVSVKPKSSIIHILPIFERCVDRAYNVKASVTNRKLEDICEETGIHFIKMNKISSESYTRDGVHFNNTGRKNLVIMIKQHLNPHLGMKPYDQYQNNYKDKKITKSNTTKIANENIPRENSTTTNGKQMKKRDGITKGTLNTLVIVRIKTTIPNKSTNKSPWYQSTQVKTSRGSQMRELFEQLLKFV